MYNAKQYKASLQTNNYAVYATNNQRCGKPHTHDNYEIFMVLKGEIDYFADGVIYPLLPKELVATRASLPHGKTAAHTDDVAFLVIVFKKEFFIENNCAQYEEIFYPGARTDHKISASVCESSGLFDVYKRLEKYTNHFQNTDNAVTRALLIEFLHILNTGTRFSKTYISKPQIEKILTYIDVHLTQKLSLDELAQEAYLSKYHMSRLFKKYVGYTINQYITMRRIEKTQALIQEKKNITEACVDAGFSDYSAFYKAFVKLHGTPPKTMMKNK